MDVVQDIDKIVSTPVMTVIVTGTLRRVDSATEIVVGSEATGNILRKAEINTEGVDRVAFIEKVSRARDEVQGIFEDIHKMYWTGSFDVTPDAVDSVYSLATMLYDPDILRSLMSAGRDQKESRRRVPGDEQLLSILSDPVCQFAASTTALLASVEEKLDITGGTTGLLKRTIDAVESSPSPLDSLLSNSNLSAKLRDRSRRARHVDGSPATHDLLSEIVRRASHIKRSPAPHHPELLSVFGGSIGIGLPITGSVEATNHHERYLTHIMKVALRQFGPFATGSDISQADPTPAIVRAFERALGTLAVSLGSPSPISTVRLCRDEGSTLAIRHESELLYGDHQALFAYKYARRRAHDFATSTSMVPESYAISDTPSELVLLKTNDKNGSGRLELDVQVFINRLAFGAGWDDHMSERRADMLLPIPVHDEQYTDPEYLLADSDFYPGGGGSAQMALTFVSAFLRDTAGSIFSEIQTDDSERKDLDDPTHRPTIARRVWAKTLRVARQAERYASHALGMGNGTIDAIMIQLLLSRVIDGVHEVRHSGIQRTNYSLHLQTKQTPSHNNHRLHLHHYHNGASSTSPDIVGRIRWVGEYSLSGFQIGGIGGGNNNLEANVAFDTTDVTIVWDGQRAEPINVVYTGRRIHHHRNHVRPQTVVAHRNRRRNRLNELSSTTGTVDGRVLLDAKPDSRPLSNLTLGGISRGFFAESRDALEVTALRAATRDASVSMRELSESIRTIEATTSEAVELRRSMVETFENADATTVSVDRATGELAVASSGRPLLEETRALASNTRSASDVLGDLGIDISPAVDEPFAAEMAETYPNSDILQADQTVRQVAESLPRSDLETFREAELEIERSPVPGDGGGIHDDRLVSALSNSKTNAQLEKTLGRRVGDGVLTFAGRYGVTLVVGGIVAGSVAPSIVARMHSSRGAHLNVKTNTLAGKVQSYKIVDFSCRDKTVGNTDSAEHPFAREIEHGIKVNPDTHNASGSIIRLNGRQSQYPAYAPVCGETDAAIGECGTWAVFDRGYALPVVASMADLPPGTSLSCEAGFSLPQAVADVAIDIGADVTTDIARAAIQVVDTVGTSILSKFLSSPLFFIGLPIIVGLATGFGYRSFPHGILAGVTLLIILLVIRYFFGTGPLTRAGSINEAVISKTGSQNRKAVADSGRKSSKILAEEKGERGRLRQLPPRQSLLLGIATVCDQETLNRLLLG
uniref:Wsv011-like protein n=1 Tax=Melicertus latisulcatus pemonivirus TaxID=2984278 RepID=A0A9C7BQG5_9VIRU|nr:MAG: wsv011-like protein [Melicertus latisulcatus pemonivirus]